MIRKLLFPTVAIVASSVAALAADLPSRRAPPVYVPPPVPVFSYTGFYAGLDLGYAFGRDNVFGTIPAAGIAAAFPVGRPNGIIGGAHVGYNLSTQSVPVFGQLASAIAGIPFIGGVGGSGGVIGIEGDVKGSDYRSVTDGLGGTIVPAFPVAETDRSQIQGTVRGRLGVAVDRALFFATGGAAFATFNNTYQNLLVPGNFATASNTRSTLKGTSSTEHGSRCTPGRCGLPKSKVPSGGGLPSRTSEETTGMPVAAVCRCTVVNVTRGTSGAVARTLAG